MAKNHPKTCRCDACPERNRSRPGRHVANCQCRGCVGARATDWYTRLAEKKKASLEAVKNERPTRGRPIFVRAHWRKSTRFLAGDPGLRELLFGAPPEKDADPPQTTH